MQVTIPSSRKLDYMLAAVSLLVMGAIASLILNLTSGLSRHEPLASITHFVDTQNDYQQTLPPKVVTKQWQVIANPVNLGMDSNSHWFAVSLPTGLNTSSKYVLEIGYPLLDSIDIWIRDDKGNVAKHFHSGDTIAFSQREMRHESFLFALPNQMLLDDVLIRVTTTGSLKLPIRLWKQERYIEFSGFKSLIMGLFFGFLVAMGVCNLFFFLTTGSKTFFVYAGYVFSLTLTLASMHGLGFAYLWPENTWFQGRAVAVFANATIMFAVVFSSWLLDVRAYSVRLANLLKAIAIVFLVSVLISLVLPYAYLIKIFLALLSIVVLITLGVGIWLALKGVVLARYYSLAWVILLISGFSASLDNMGYVTLPIHSNYLLMLGASVETLLLALVLAIGYSRERQQLYDAQEKALDQEKDILAAKEALIEAQQQSQDELEYKVQERTLELEIALRELSEANRELENLNTIDPLTGIRNRRHFDKRLLAEGRRSRREQTYLSVAMVDIDHFKRINDEHGHSAGDACIKHVASQLQNLLRRSTDDVCRYGGEEFAVILPNTELDGAKLVLESMRNAIEANPVSIDGIDVAMTVSAGVASMIILTDEQELELLKFADEQLYAAKQDGRNRVKAATLSGTNQ